MTAREAALKDIANSILRRLLAFYKSFTCADAKVGDAALFFEAQSKRTNPRRRRPAPILEIDETGVTARFQSQILKAARFCVGKKGGGRLRSRLIWILLGSGSSEVTQIWGIDWIKWTRRRVLEWTGEIGIPL